MHREVAIVGVYATEQARRLPGRTSMDLTIEAVKGAIADAGLLPSDVDGAAVTWPGRWGSSIDSSSNWAPWLNGRLRWTNDASIDAAGVRGVLKAASAISYGLCDTVVIGAGLAGSWNPLGEADTSSKALGSGLDMEFSDPYGQWVMPQFALLAQRYMHEFGTTAEQLACVSATIRNNGHSNPEAVMYGQGPYTVDDVLNSRMVASPFHLLDCCLVAEGGFAIVLTSLENAVHLPHRPVIVAGGGMEFAKGAYADPPMLRDLHYLGREGSQRALDQAGLRIDEMDVLSLYDATSFEVIRQLDMLGICEPGEAGPAVAGGLIAMDGEYPVNPDGGLLAHSWASPGHLSQRVIECVRQIRGTAVNQLDSPQHALATNAGSATQHIEVAVLVGA